MTEQRSVRAHLRRLASGRLVEVPEHQARRNVADREQQARRRRRRERVGVSAAIAGSAVLAGAPVALVVIGAVVVGAVVVAARHPRRAQAAASAGLNAATITVSTSREVLGEFSEWNSRRRREQKFERETMQTLRWLVDCDPELLAFTLDELRDGESLEEALRCAKQAEQAVHRLYRTREMLARFQAIAEQTRRIYRRIEELSETLDANYERFFKASATDWVFMEPFRENPPKSELQKAAELHALGELSEGQVPENITRVLKGPLDDVLAMLLGEHEPDTSADGDIGAGTGRVTVPA